MATITTKPRVDARKFAPPAYGRTVTLPSLEALHEYLKLHEQTHEVLGWRGGVLVLRRKPQPVAHEMHEMNRMVTDENTNA